MSTDSNGLVQLQATAGDTLTTNGRLGHLTAAQQTSFDKLKNEIASLKEFEKPGPHFTDQYVLRFLRARDFDVSKSKAMIKKAEQWRNTVNAEQCFQKPVLGEEEEKVVNECWKQYLHRTDKLGRPLYIQNSAVADVKKLYSVTTDDRLSKNFVRMIERVIREVYPACAKAANNELVDATFIVMNMKDANWSTFWTMRTPFRNIIDFSQNYQPETIGRVMIINAPSIFSYIWSWVKGWLSPQTVAKISIHGEDYLDKMRELVDDENIPRSLGGGCKLCEDCTKSNIGPWNDENPGPPFEKQS